MTLHYPLFIPRAACVLSACSPLVVKAIANLDKDFAGIQIVRSAECEAVIQKNAAICDVETLNIHRKTLAEALSNRDVERGVRVEMVARDSRVAVREARSIINISGCVASPGQRVLTAYVQRVPLVVVKKLEAIAKREVRESAVDVSETKRKLVRVGQINLATIADARRAQR